MHDVVVVFNKKNKISLFHIPKHYKVRTRELIMPARFFKTISNHIRTQQILIQEIKMIQKPIDPKTREKNRFVPVFHEVVSWE